MSRAELIEAMGDLYGESPPGVLRWREKHVDCVFHPGSKVVSEVRFNKGFQGALANGIKLGSSGNDLLKLYGKPEHAEDRGNGAKQYEYSSKGILFWTNQRKVAQIVVFEPYQLAAEKPASEPSSPTPATTNAADTIVEASGWPHAKVGMNREELIAAMGEPGSESPPGVLRWPDKHVDCAFHPGSKVVSEVRFNEGFPAPWPTASSSARRAMTCSSSTASRSSSLTIAMGPGSTNTRARAFVLDEPAESPPDRGLQALPARVGQTIARVPQTLDGLPALGRR